MSIKVLSFALHGKDVSASDVIDGVRRKVDDSASSWHRMGIAAGAVAAAGLAAASVAAVKFGIDSVKAFADAEDQQNKLAFAFEKFPALADTNQKALQDLNSELQKKTRFDDDAIAAGQATLAQYQLTGKQITELTPLMLDFATKTGTDLPTASEQLGKALLGQGRAMKAVGIDFVDTGSVAGNFDEIVTGLNTNVGGLAETAGTTASGKLDILKDRFQDVQEKVGEALMPVLDKLMTFMEEDFIPLAEGFATWLSQTGIPAIQSVVDWITRWKDIIGPAVTAIGTLTAAAWLLNLALDANPIGAVVAGISALITIASLVTINFDQIWKWFTEHPWGLALLPLASGVVSITLLINALINFGPQLGDFFNTLGTWLWNLPIIGNVTFGQFVQGAVGAFTMLGQWFQFGFGLFQGLIGWFVNLAIKGWEMYTNIVNIFGQVYANIVSFVSGFGSSISTVGDWLSQLVTWVSERIGEVIAWFTGLKDKVTTALSDAINWLKTIGHDVIQGLINGVNDMAQGALDTIKGVANSIIDGVKKFFGIQSPSTVFHGIGGNLIKGLINGILGQAGNVPKVLGHVFGGIPQNIMGALQVLGGVGGDLFSQIFGNIFGAGGGSSAAYGGGGAAQWSGVVAQVLQLLGQPQSLMGAVLRRIDMESGGNPTIQNNWDSNAAAGHPSIGLMQTIPSTFNAYAGPYRNLGITNPLANIYAGLNYAIQRYGSIGAIDPLVRPIGYDSGGVLEPGISLVHNDTGKPEYVIPPGGLGLSLVGAVLVLDLGDGETLRGVIKKQITAADGENAARIRMG